MQGTRIAWKQVALLDLDQLAAQRDVRCLQRSLHETAYGVVTPADLQVRCNGGAEKTEESQKTSFLT
jgi:hypothetical protein